MMGPDEGEDQQRYYLTGQVVSAYRSQERFQTIPYKGLPACAKLRLAGRRQGPF